MAQEEKRAMMMVDAYATEFAASQTRACRTFTDMLDTLSDKDMMTLYRDIQLMFAAGK